MTRKMLAVMLGFLTTFALLTSLQARSSVEYKIQNPPAEQPVTPLAPLAEQPVAPPRPVVPEFINFPVQGQWERGTNFYADVLNHSKTRPLYFDNRDTDAHENTHLIDASIRNDIVISTNFKRNVEAFYVGGDRAVVVDQPNLKLLQVAEFVPAKLREGRFRTYLHTQPTTQPILNGMPLYVWYEWNGYVNGSTVTVEDAEAGRPNPLGKNDCVFANVEFMVYSMALGMAVEQHDPEYFQTNTQFKNFLVWQAHRSMAIYHRGYRFPDLQWNPEYINELRTGPGGRTIREFMERSLGIDVNRLLTEGQL